jgi:hypothetical protein
VKKLQHTKGFKANAIEEHSDENIENTPKASAKSKRQNLVPPLPLPVQKKAAALTTEKLNRPGSKTSTKRVN